MTNMNICKACIRPQTRVSYMQDVDDLAHINLVHAWSLFFHSTNSAQGEERVSNAEQVRFRQNAFSVPPRPRN